MMGFLLITSALLSVTPIQQTDTTFAVRPGTRLDIENFSGHVSIRTWSRNEMRVQADHSSRAGVFVLRHSSSLVNLRTRHQFGPKAVDYDIMVPASTDIDINGTFTSADVDGVEGSVRINTVQGDIFVNGGRGRIALGSVQGDVALENADGRINVESVNGSVSVENSTGTIRAEGVNGRIRLERITSSDVSAVTTNGSVSYDGTIERNGQYSLSTHNGDVTVIMDAEVDAVLTISTFQGDIDSDFPLTLQRTRGRDRRFTFTLGQGSARIELESFGGTIRLQRRSAGRR